MMFLVNDNDLFDPLLTLSLPGSVVLSQRIVTSTVYSVRLSGCLYLPEHGALHGGAVVGQGQRRPALPAGASRRQVAEEEVRHPLRQLRLLLQMGSSLPILYYIQSLGFLEGTPNLVPQQPPSSCQILET